MALPPARDLFDRGLTPSEVSQRYDDFIGKVSQARARVIGMDDMAHNNSGRSIDWDAPTAPVGPLGLLEKAAASPDLVKSLSPEALESLNSALAQVKAQVPDLTKDISLTSPIASGLVAYDLEPAAKMLTPRPTPLRNRITRKRGIGKAHEYKRITGFTGTGTGGVGVLRPGITDASQTSFANPGSANALYYNRGAKISYAGDSVAVPYIQFGLSDQTSWSTQYSGQGFQDIRSLQRASLMYSSFLMEERETLYGRGTAGGFSGVLAAPTGVSGTARAAGAGEVGITTASANAYVRVVAEMGDVGVSQASTATGAIAFTTGQVIDVTYTLPAGATGARVFVSVAAGADPGDAARWLYTNTIGTIRNGRSGYNVLTLQGLLPTAGTAVTAYPNPGQAGGTINLTAADGASALATAYDGIWAYCTGANAGYRNTLNAVFSTTNPGVEFQNAFAALYDAVKTSPDRCLMNGFDRKQLSDTIKGSANSNYVMRVQQDEITGITLGTVAVGVVNEVTGMNVDLEVHPWLMQGNIPILKDRLDVPDSNVDSIFAYCDVQPIMGVDWPVNQFSFDTSTYWYGTFLCYAPGWLGSLSGVKLA